MTGNKDQKHRIFKLKITNSTTSCDRRGKWGSDKLICSREGRRFAQGHSTSYWTADFLSSPLMSCPPCQTTSSDSLRGPWTEGGAICWESQSRALAPLSPPTWRWFVCGDELTHSACSDHHSCPLFLSSHENVAHWETFENCLEKITSKTPWAAQMKGSLYSSCLAGGSAVRATLRGGAAEGPSALTMEPGGYGVGGLLVACSQG